MNPGVKAIDFGNPPLTMNLSLVERKGNSPVAAAEEFQKFF